MYTQFYYILCILFNDRFYLCMLQTENTQHASTYSKILRIDKAMTDNFKLIENYESINHLKKLARF